MGVPAFFRWLSRKYPSVIVHCVEEKTVNVNGVRIPIDSSGPNPNGVEFDNLYLDMNGIIHPCTHPEDRPAPRNEDEMMVAIFECVDRLFRIVRPRKLLYMAIDGVAPRAKMNQQRSRRFRAAKESVEKVNEVNRVRSELLLKGATLPPEKAKEEHFDTNCITPGTPFMDRLSKCLHYYIHDRLNNDPGWHGIKVILSDANVPGEGEHKIMDFIRKQRAQPDHDPNTQHCLCGADADLIMLGLATHEPNFTIIREEFKPNKPRPCDICGQIGHEMKDCLGIQRGPETDMIEFGAETDFIFVRLNVLREYLERELAMPNLPFKYEFERVLDDWVFMCFFVGNDFLPHLPSLEIREGAIDRLITLYKDCVYKTGGYLTDSGNVNLQRVQRIMLELGKVEDEIFKKRQENELAFKAREKAKKRRSEGYGQYRPNFSLLQNTQFAPKRVDQANTVMNVRQESFNIRRAGMHMSSVEVQLQTTSNQNALQAMMTPVGEQAASSSSSAAPAPHGQKRKLEDVDQEEEDDHQAHDEVRLWEDGFKDRYYESKFDVAADKLEFRYHVAAQYVRGLCWVLQYYYQGCASWNWYFPYHYAPFASDFINIAQLSTKFDSNTKPFNPLEQLMGVFPAASSAHVPKPWAKLMSDPDSSIIDFYPEDFKIDLNGKKFAWQGVALLPFVDEKRLFKALKPYYKLLTDEERRRNLRGDDRLYVSNKNKGYGFIRGLYENRVNAGVESAISIDGMSGTVTISNQCVRTGGNLDSPVRGLLTIRENVVYCVNYQDPKYPQGHIFPAIRLKGAKEPLRVLKPQDFEERGGRNWRPIIGMAPSNTRATLGPAGHRMVNHHAPRPTPGTYSNVPPPAYADNNRGSYYQQQRGRPNNNYGNQGGSGGGGGGGGGYWGSYGGGGNNSGGYNRGNNYQQQQQQQQQQRGYNSGYQHGYQNRDREERGRFERDNRPPGPYRDNYVPNANRYSARR